MVKLFVGNLAESIDSTRLRNLFQQHVPVEECDVLKNFAFVHVEKEEDADKAIEKFNKYKLEGKEIHVERSTSHLRKQPGMSDKCFTCGAEEHKTSQCPRNPNARKRNGTGAYKYSPHEPLIKKPKPLIFAQPQDIPGIHPQQHYPVQQQQQPQIVPAQCWGYKVEGSANSAESDPELPCPQNPELHRLYEQYLESRTRYFFFREQLTKELRLLPPQQPQSASSTIPSVLSSLGTNNGEIVRVDLTQFVRSNGQHAPRSVLAEQQQRQVQQHVQQVQQSALMPGALSSQPQLAMANPMGGHQPYSSLAAAAAANANHPYANANSVTANLYQQQHQLQQANPPTQQAAMPMAQPTSLLGIPTGGGPPNVVPMIKSETFDGTNHPPSAPQAPAFQPGYPTISAPATHYNTTTTNVRHTVAAAQAAATAPAMPIISKPQSLADVKPFGISFLK